MKTRSQARLAGHVAQETTTTTKQSPPPPAARWRWRRWIVATTVVLVAVLCAVLPQRPLRVPPHMLNEAVYETNLLTPEQHADLRALMLRMKEFPSNLADLNFYTTVHEHIGEGQPISADGSCTDPFLIPNQNRTLCILPGRIDVGRHFIMTGGPEGRRESYETLISRVQSFGRYMFSLDEYPEAQRLFADPRFRALAKRICPADKQYLDPFQFNFILQLPGQTVAAHLDGVYFWGATRFQFPQWLLAVMVFSGRFQDVFVDQVQVVAYLHDWDPSTRTAHKAGEFIHWASPAEPLTNRTSASERSLVATAPAIFDAEPRAGSAIDGSKSVHAAEVYLGSPASPPLPFLNKNDANMLRAESSEGGAAGGEDAGWTLLAGERVLQRYKTDDLRSTVVYRARCFADAEEAARFGGNGGPDPMSLDHVLTVLAEELVRMGRVRSVEAALAMDRKKFAFLMMDSFIRYPLPPRPIPYNHCALPRLLPPWAKPLVEKLLSPTCNK